MDKEGVVFMKYLKYLIRQEDILTDDTYVAKIDTLVNIDGKSPREKVKNITFDNLDL